MPPQQNGAGSEVNVWVVDQARRHLRHPHRALGDGAGHAHRPRPARRRGARVRLEARSRPKASRPAATSRSKRAWGEMGTGGSRGIRTSQDYVRRGGAAARMMLLQAAADQWKVPVARAHGVRTASSPTRRRKRKTSYGKVAAAAAKVTPPDPKTHQAQGPEGLEDRRQAAEAARHRRQAQRQQDLRDRRQAARHAERRDQGLPGVRRQAR